MQFDIDDCTSTIMQLLKSFCSLRMTKSTPVMSVGSRFLVIDLGPSAPPLPPLPHKTLPTAPSPVSVMATDECPDAADGSPPPSRATVCATTVSSFLVKAFDKLCKHGVLTTTTPWDATNAVEVALLLALHVVEVPEAGMAADTQQRLLLCACLTLAIKAPLDSVAFGRLITTQYHGVPFALVYFYMFENAVIGASASAALRGCSEVEIWKAGF